MDNQHISRSPRGHRRLRSFNAAEARKCISGLALALSLAGSAIALQSSPQGSSSEVIGKWEGESNCTIPDSPCHNEHVVYEIKADSRARDELTLDAYKVVGGQQQFMGTLDCRHTTAEHALRCVGRRPDDIWNFILSGDRMAGTLTIGADKKLYRKIDVSRKGQ